MKKAFLFCGLLVVVAGIALAATEKLDGVDYTKITPREYADRMKNGKIGIHERYVIEGLILSATENEDGTGSLAIQSAGITNLFKLEKPITLEMGQRVRIYVEVTLVNLILVKMSEAQVVKLEKI